MLSVEDIQTLFTSIGRSMFPLASVDDAAALLEAAAAVPQHVPRRGMHLCNMLNRFGSALASRAHFGIEAIASTLAAQPAAARVMHNLPAAEGLILLTQRYQCIVDAGWVQRRPCHRKPLCVTADDTADFVHYDWSRSGPAASKAVRSCAALHFFSYAAGGDLLELGSIQPYPECMGERYIHFNVLFGCWRLSDAGIVLPASPLSSIEGVYFTMEKYSNQLTLISNSSSCARGERTTNRIAGFARLVSLATAIFWVSC